MIQFADAAQEPVFRPMALDDIPAVAQLERVCFRSPWSERMLKDELKNPSAHYHVLELDGTIVAYAGMWVILDEAHITNVAVAPGYRRLGLGKRIMLQSMQAALALGAGLMTLEVRESNIGAQAMYFELDFHPAGRRKKYYSDTKEDAILMWNRDVQATLQRLQG